MRSRSRRMASPPPSATGRAGHIRCSKPGQGRTLLRTSRLSEAAAVLEGRFDLEDGSRAASILEAAGIVALGRLALHLGDTRQVRRLRGIAQVMFERGTPAVRRHAAWLLAVFAAVVVPRRP